MKSYTVSYCGGGSVVHRVRAESPEEAANKRFYEYPVGALVEVKGGRLKKPRTFVKGALAFTLY